MQLKRLTTMAAIGVTATAAAVVVANPAAAATTVPGTYNSVTPASVLDTRSGVGAPKASVASGRTLTFKATGPAGSASVSAVSLTMTVIAPPAGGFVTVFRGGTARPATSSINFDRGRTVPNAVVAQVGTGGTVSVYNGSAGAVNLTAAVSGYWAGGTVGSDTAGAYAPVVPTRLADSRASGSTALAFGASAAIKVTGRAGIPADAAGVLVNIGATAPKAGFFIASSTPEVDAGPNSVVNFPANTLRANLATVPVNTDGSISVTNRAAAAATYLVDVVGYFTRGSDNTPAVEGAYLPSDAYRAIDTRETKAVAKGGTVKVPILGQGQNSTLKAVAVNITAIPAFGGFLSTWNGVGSRPTANQVSLTAGITQAGLAIVPINNDGTISIFNATAGAVHFAVDVHGFVLNDLSGLSAKASQQRINRVVAAAQTRAVR